LAPSSAAQARRSARRSSGSSAAVLLNSLATSLGGPFATLNQRCQASTATLANIFGSVVGSTVDRVLEPE
jgi:hypothetical protein